MAKAKRDWKLTVAEALEMVRLGAIEPSFAAIARHYGERPNTVSISFNREGVTLEDLQAAAHKDTSSRIHIDEESANSRTVEVFGSKAIKTLEDLLEAAEVDLEEWDVERHVINTWTTSMKIENTTPIQVPNWQVKAWLRRRKLEALSLPIVPVELVVDRPPLPNAMGEETLRYLAIFDPQVGFSKDIFSDKMTPFHDRRVLDIAEQVLEMYPFDGVYGGGDWMDLSGFTTKFTVMPEYRFTTQASLVEASYWLQRLRVKALLEGNHDKRLADAVHSYNVHEAYGLRPVDALDGPPVLTMEFLLGLKDAGIEYVRGYPDAEIWIGDNCRIVHGDVAKAKPGHTAAAVAEKSEVNTMFGHIHRQEQATRNVRDGRDGHRKVRAFSPGCACHIDGRVPGSRDYPDWQQGLGVITISEDIVSFSSIPIEDGVGIFDGVAIEARDRDQEMDEIIRDALDLISVEVDVKNTP